MSKMSRDELLQLIPAYTLGALDDDERSQVEALLVNDAEAQALENDFRQIEQVLPMMVPLRQPPADLKNRLLQRIHEDPEKAEDTQLTEDTDPEPDNIVHMPEKPKQLPPRRRYILPLVATVAIAVAGLIFVLLATTEPTATPQTIFQTLYNQPNADRIYVPASDDSPVHGSLLISEDREQAALRVEKLPTLDIEQTFQLWIVSDDGVQSGGLYQANENAEVYIVLPIDKPVNNYSRFGMSIEPAGGSPLGDAPSGPRVFGVDVPADI